MLVARKDKVQQVKDVVARLKADARTQAVLHREVHRPWGSYDSVDVGERFQVKRIKVKLGARLSLQSHACRAEHWVVVRGIRVTRDNDVFDLYPNQSTYIPIGAKHRLETRHEPLELIEVQSGDYLGDDIVRLRGRVRPQPTRRAVTLSPTRPASRRRCLPGIRQQRAQVVARRCPVPWPAARCSPGRLRQSRGRRRVAGGDANEGCSPAGARWRSPAR